MYVQFSRKNLVNDVFWSFPCYYVFENQRHHTYDAVNAFPWILTASQWKGIHAGGSKPHLHEQLQVRNFSCLNFFAGTIMGIKKPSKSKLKREAKRAAKLKAEGKVPDKKHATEIADSNDEVPEAVPLQDLDLNAEEMQELEELEAAFKQLHDQEDNKSDDEEDEDENEQVENGVEEEEEEGESEAEENDEDDEDEEDSGDEDDEQDTDNKETRKPERVKANDKDKMLRILEEFKLKKLPWIETMSVTSSEPISVEDPNDDMKRELAFYQQALEAAKIGREKVLEAGVPFTRPDDYFAEMIKSDEHMAKIRTRLMNEAARIKASEDAKKQRHNKKFGKKLQLEKERERQKQKAETLEKIKQLKRSKS